MTEGPSQDDQGSGRPHHTPEEEQAFNKRIRLLEHYTNLSASAVDTRRVDCLFAKEGPWTPKERHVF